MGVQPQGLVARCSLLLLLCSAGWAGRRFLRWQRVWQRSEEPAGPGFLRVRGWINTPSRSEEPPRPRPGSWEHRAQTLCFLRVKRPSITFPVKQLGGPLVPHIRPSSHGLSGACGGEGPAGGAQGHPSASGRGRTPQPLTLPVQNAV